MLLNKIGYDPIDDDSPSGYKRPPKIATCVADYFHVLGFVEDDGKFATEEMDCLLSSPETFFSEPSGKDCGCSLKTCEHYYPITERNGRR